MKKLFIIFILILAWLQYRIWSPDGGVSEWLRLQNDLSLAQKKIDALTVHNESLKNIVLDLQTHTAAIETQAREVLHLIAPGETFFRVITIQSNPGASYVPELPRTRLSVPQVDAPADTADEAPP
jgi:cell division protein FtsB